MGIQELIMIILILFFILLVVVGLVFLVRTLFKPKKSNSFSNQPERLKELEKMKNDGLINEDEFNKKRNEIINNL